VSDELLGLLADCGELLARPSDPLTAMSDVVRAIGQSLDADRMLYFVRDAAAGVSHCIAAWIRDGIDPMQPGPYRDQDFAEVIGPLVRGEVYSSPIANKSGRNLEVNSDSGTTADLLVPVIVDGELRGILGIDQCRGQRGFSSRQVNALRAMAALLASTLARSAAEGVRSRAVERQHHAREAAVESAATVVGDLLSIGELELALDRVLPQIGAMVACHCMVVLLRDEIDGRRCHRVCREWLAPGQPSPSIVDATVVFDDMTPAGAVAGLESGSPFWWRTARRGDPFSLRHQALGVAMIGALPLLVEGGYAGMLAFGWCFEPDLGADGVELRVLQLAANAIAAALQRQRATERQRDRERERREALLAERSRMAREIHDGVAQSFTGILLQLGALAETPGDLAQSQELARRATGLAREGLADARRAMMALQAEDSAREDLESALAQLVELVSVPGKVACRLHSHGRGFDAVLGPARAHDLYRVVQEALSNALRHARATGIEVTLARTPAGIRLQVQDDGTGFVEGGSDGFGIRNMRARVQDMGGSLRIESTLGAGTRLIVDLPPAT
jgi:signal transduction histidine kinase